MKLIGFTFVYNEEGMIPYVVPYIRSMGYDKFVIYDDDCSDNTIPLLKTLLDGYTEVDIRKPEQKSEGFEGRKRDAMLASINECAEIINANNGEDLWMTWTDFDEVLYCSRERDELFKNNLKLFNERGYNFFSGRMLHLTWNGDYESKGAVLPHQWNGVRGTWWLSEGKKVTLFKVNDLAKFMCFCGNHHFGVLPREGVELKDLDSCGEFHGFHMKYFNREVLEHKTMQLVHDASVANDKIRANSFPLDMYFLLKGMFAQQTAYNRRDPGEGLFLIQ